MPKLLRIFLPLVLAALVISAVTSAAPPNPTQNIGGWGPPHTDADPPGLNSNGFIPAPRSSNMIWLNSIIGGPNWISPVLGGGGAQASDYAFTKLGGVHYAIEADYNNYRFVDLTDQSISCYDAWSATRDRGGCAPILSDNVCVGGQGDVAVHGTLLIRAHESTNAVPNGDITKTCPNGGNEIQWVELNDFDVDGNSYQLRFNNQNSIPIVRGQNNTTAGISAALQGGNEQQQVLLTGYDNNGDSFTLTHGANTSVPFVRGTNYTQAAIQTALQGTAEVQTVTLSNYTVDARQYQLTYNGNQTTPIVRGQNNTAQGVQNALQGGNEIQAVTLTGFNPASNNFRLRFTGSANLSAVIGTGGATYDATGLQNAINAITGFAGGVTVSAVTNGGFTVTFAGASANINAAALQVVECNNGLDPCTYANRENARGGTAMTGWPALGTVAVGTVTDTGYTLTFSGAHQGTNVSPVTVTSGTGGVTGVVAETTAGAAGILPSGTQAATGTPNDAGFTVTFSGAAANTDVGPLTVTNPVDTGGAAATAGSVRETAKGTLGVTGWVAGGTATVASLSDLRYSVTFAGTLAAINVGDLSVVNGTGTPAVTGSMTLKREGSSTVTFRGITIIDISDPAHPQEIKGVPMCGNTHTITKYYDDISNKLFILGTSGGGTTQPQWGLTSCPAFSSPYGSGFEEVVEIPLDHPEDAKVLKDRRVAVGGNGNCHDVNVFEEIHFMVTACSGTGGSQFVDLSNIATGGTFPTLPGIGFSWPGLQTVHQATISWSGRIVTVSGEPGGGSGGECSFQDDTNKPLIHILDRATGKMLGQWALPRPQTEAGAENCTTHTLNIAPFLDRNIMAWSGYTAGGSVIDYTNPKAPREIAFFDQLTLAGTGGAGCWTNYWYNDTLYCNELQFGQHAFTVDEPWWKQAMTLDELNPQTNTRLIRCQVSFTGGPTKAKKNGTVNVNVKVFGPAPLQAAWGALAEIRAPGYYKAVKTGEAGTASAVVKSTAKGKLSVTVPAMENMIGCSAPTKNIAKAGKKAKK